MTVSSAPVVSVVVCTRNRAGDLRTALESLNAQAPGTPPFEVIVVDNASTDDTARVSSEYADRLSLQYVLESRIGLCHARNTGWRQAKGHYIAYFDDDAVASPGWVGAIVEAFRQAPLAGVVGGRVEPIWQAPRPPWLSDQVAFALTIVDWSAEPKTLEDLRAEWLVGANMAIRADVLRRIGGFREELGRVGSRLLSNEDTFLLREVIGLGYSCFYFPDMAVKHLTSASRLNKAWFRRRYYWQGVSDAAMEIIETRPTTRARVAMGLRASWDLLRRPGRVRTLLPTDDPEEFAETCWTLIAIGRAVGLLTTARVEDART